MSEIPEDKKSLHISLLLLYSSGRGLRILLFQNGSEIEIIVCFHLLLLFTCFFFFIIIIRIPSIPLTKCV